MADKQEKTKDSTNPSGAKRMNNLGPYAVLLVLILVMIAGLWLVKPAKDSGDGDRTVSLKFLQLNDVYQILPSDLDGSGGLARVATLRKELDSEPNIIFVLAGDTLSPSLESIVFQGEQIIDLWNAVGLNVAVFGNHEFDFKPDVLRKRINQSHFTWLGANVVDKTTGSPVGGAQPYLIKEVDGVRVGIFGLLTQETLRISQPGPDTDILDPFETARRIVPQMRAQGAQVIIALTHLSLDEDTRLAKAVKLDLILGGHEHEMIQSQSEGTPIYKMGSDARNLGRIEMKVDARTGQVQGIVCRVTPVTKGVQEEPRAKAMIDEWEKKLEDALKVKLDDSVGETTVDLDALETSVRARESNAADFIADAFREATGADVALTNGGGIRSDRIYPAGAITNRRVYSMLPFKNDVVLISVTGADLRKALERGVSQVVENQEDGGFAQVSGLRFVYNGLQPPGSRVVSVKVGTQDLDDNRTYKLATISYLADGNQGYDMFRGKPRLSSPANGKTDAQVVLETIKKAGKISPALDGRITRKDAR